VRLFGGALPYQDWSRQPIGVIRTGQFDRESSRTRAGWKWEGTGTPILSCLHPLDLPISPDYP